MPEREFLPTETQQLAPRVLPFNWKRIQPPYGPFTEMAMYKGGAGLRVLFSVSRERDGRNWIHVSFSRIDRIPDWRDLRIVKDLFIGKDKEALQILPPEAEYVNIHPHTLHLFHCLDERITPDFREEGGI